VIKVNGNIVIERTGNSLETGTSFPQDESLVFRIPESRAAVINPSMGRFLLTAENVNEFKNAKSNFLPSAGKISTRAVEDDYYTGDPADKFTDNFVILNKTEVLIDTTHYPMKGDRFFYISYNFNDKTINKKLSFNSDTLIIRKAELLTVDGKEIAAPETGMMKLIYYVEGNAYLIKPVGSFIPVFPDQNELRQEISVILDKMEMKGYDDKLNEINHFIREFYGSIDETSLKVLLKEDFGLRQ
jgi:hypothetical protein